MIIKEIQEFAENRYKARAYMCYLFNRNIPNYLPGVSEETIMKGFNKISHEIYNFDIFYLIDKNGIQISDNISNNDDPFFHTGKGENRNNKAYFYRAVKEGRCILTDPYPSSATNELCVTASIPIYNDKRELLYVACIDIKLTEMLKIVNPSSIDSVAGKFVKLVYTLFSLGLFVIVILFFYRAMKIFFIKHVADIKLGDMFESIIVLTLALAIFDLVKAIFEEEVLGFSRNNNSKSLTMIKFVASIIIALAIESLMFVFKIAITEPDKIIYAVFLIIGVAVLMVSLGFYMYIANKVKD